MILDAEYDIEVVGEADDAAAAVELVTALKPDVVLMDVRMPGVDGLEATCRIAGEHVDGVHSPCGLTPRQAHAHP